MGCSGRSEKNTRERDSVWPSRACGDPGSPSGIFDFCHARQDDFTYVVLTLIVFAVLIYSLVGWHL